MKGIKFKIKEKSAECSVFFSSDIFIDVPQYLKKSHLGSKYVIITDKIIERLYGKKLLRVLKRGGLDAILISFKSGEKSKNRRTKELVEDKMLLNSCKRDTVIIAFGGGVVGDLAGFVAATYMRGVPFIQIPTTTLACVDSSYGGKTAIDTAHGKNLIGAFHNPIAIFVDTNLFLSLNERNYLSGLVEAIKHGIIKDKEFFSFIEKNVNTIIYRKSKDYKKVMDELLSRNVMIKKEVIEKDNRESNLRMVLNYGHTIGHAIETLSDYTLLHGEAVAIGIGVEGYISYKMGYLKKDGLDRQIELLKMFDQKISIPKEISTGSIIDVVQFDKKTINGKPNIILIDSTGKVKTSSNGSFSSPISRQKLRKLLDEYRKKYK